MGGQPVQLLLRVVNFLHLLLAREKKLAGAARTASAAVLLARRAINKLPAKS
jgi:hypothetical protein